MTPQPTAIVVAGLDPPHLRRAGYAGRVGEHFTIAMPHRRPTQLSLESVTDLTGVEGRDDAFSLVFSGPPGLGSATRTLRHPSLGTFALLISPIGPRAGQQDYEAIVNRSRGVRRRRWPRWLRWPLSRR